MAFESINEENDDDLFISAAERSSAASRSTWVSVVVSTARGEEEEAAAIRKTIAESPGVKCVHYIRTGNRGDMIVANSSVSRSESYAPFAVANAITPSPIK